MIWNRIFKSFPQGFYFFATMKTNPIKVQQRGLRAARGIITQLLTDVDSGPKHPVLIVDVLPNRLGTWRKAHNLVLFPTFWFNMEHVSKHHKIWKTDPGSVNGPLLPGSSRRSSSLNLRAAPSMSPSLLSITRTTTSTWAPARTQLLGRQWASGGMCRTKQALPEGQRPSSKRLHPPWKFWPFQMVSWRVLAIFRHSFDQNLLFPKPQKWPRNLLESQGVKSFHLRWLFNGVHAFWYLLISFDIF